MKKYVLLLCLLASACINLNPVTFSHRQNGRDIYIVRCNSPYFDISDCYRNASQACNGNFEIFNTSIENAGVTTDMQVQSGLAPLLSGTQNYAINRSLMFYCK